MSAVSMNTAEKVNYYVHLATAVIVVVDCAGQVVALMNGDESLSDSEMISTGVKLMALGGNVLDAVAHFTQSRVSAHSSPEELSVPSTLHGLRLVELAATFNVNPLPAAVKLMDGFLNVGSLVYNGCIFKWRAAEIQVKKEE